MGEGCLGERWWQREPKLLMPIPVVLTPWLTYSKTQMPTRTIYLPDQHDNAVTNEVEDGEFDNRSKAIQHAVNQTYNVEE